MSAPTIAIVGVGPGDPAYLTRRGQELIAVADVAAGFRSVLAVVRPWIRGAEVVLDYRTQDETLAALATEAARGRRCVVCMWGDPSVSGRELIARVRRAGETVLVGVEVVPGISSVQVACAREGLALERVIFITLHAHDTGDHDGPVVAELVSAIRDGRRHVVALPRPWDLMPPALAGQLIAHGVAGSRPVVVHERLTLDDERAHRLSLVELAASTHEFSDLSLLVLPLEG